MPKLPSLKQLVNGLTNVIKRFPLEVFTCLVGSIAFMLMLEFDGDREGRQILVSITLVSNLALTLFLSASLFMEQRTLTKTTFWLVKIIPGGIAFGLFFFLHPFSSLVSVFQYGFLIVAFHLLVSFVPFINNGSISAFWEYNKQILLRFLLSALYSSVLYAGLCIALVSADQLFSLDFDYQIYGHLAALVFGVFNTVFFLAGILSDWKQLEENYSYPKGLKIFTQFVLIPLATIYLAILLAYEVKVIAEWSLPKGLVASLVLGYAVYGILSILLIYPIRNDAENRWIKIFSNLFYALLIPLIVLLVLAVYWRVGQYGITEARYILIVLSLWLTCVTGYFLFSRSQNIRVIPMSLFTIAMVSVWGPQSASTISERSQMKTLIRLFKENNAFKNGIFKPLPDTVSSSVSEQAASIIDFMVERTGTKSFKPYLEVNLDSLDIYENESSYNRESRYEGALEELLNVRPGNNNYQFYSATAKEKMYPIKGYDLLLPFTFYNYSYRNEDSRWDNKEKTLTIGLPDSERVVFDLHEIISTIKKNGPNASLDDLSVKTVNDSSTYLLMFKEISLREENGEDVIQTSSGYLLVDQPE
jgi:hypothetical protein